MPAPVHSRATVLNSWKEIASYLDRGVRTVQRWERDLKLPVHRMRGEHGPVFAFPSELDLWLHLSGFNGKSRAAHGNGQPGARPNGKAVLFPEALLERSRSLMREITATAWAQQQHAQALLGIVRLMSERWSRKRNLPGKVA